MAAGVVVVVQTVARRSVVVKYITHDNAAAAVVVIVSSVKLAIAADKALAYKASLALAGSYLVVMRVVLAVWCSVIRSQHPRTWLEHN